MEAVMATITQKRTRSVPGVFCILRRKEPREPETNAMNAEDLGERDIKIALFFA
jgi:hypothetical protein